MFRSNYNLLITGFLSALFLTGSTSGRMWTTLCLVAGLLLSADGAAHHPTTLPEPTPTPLSLRNLFRIIFWREDNNSDGVHSLVEFEQLWGLSDMNGDGAVTVTEYTYSDQFGKFTGTELYKYFDHDHNGVINLQELPRIFTEYDTNFDGRITEQEFIDENIRIYKYITNDVGTDNSYFGQRRMVRDKDIDGGWAWVVLAATCLGMVAAGTAAISTGFLQVEFLEHFSQSTSYTSLVTSAFLCLELGMGPFSSLLCNMFSVRVAMMTGGVLMSLGLIIASFATDILHLLLAFGALGGAGFGLVYTPLNVIVGHYFTHRQPLANGMSLAACGAGAAVGAYFMLWLIDSYGWRMAVSALACVSLQFCVIGCLYFPTKHTKTTLSCTRHERISGECRQPETCLWFLKDARWWIMCFNYGLLVIGYSIQIVHFPAYAESVHIDHALLPGLFTTYGVVISIDRVLCGVLCNDSTVDLRMVFFSTQALEGLVIVFMPLYARDYAGFMAYQILVSLFYGASLVPVTPLVVQLFGVERLSTVFGWIMLWGGAGSLAGPVIAGWLHDATLSYSSGFHVGGLFVVVAALLILLIPGCKLGTFESQNEVTMETLEHEEQTALSPSLDL